MIEDKNVLSKIKTYAGLFSYDKKWLNNLEYERKTILRNESIALNFE